jgi:hypothetical protein
MTCPPLDARAEVDHFGSSAVSSSENILADTKIPVTQLLESVAERTLA